MAKNRTYLYIALGVILLAIITSAFYFRTSSVKEGLSSWQVVRNTEINGHNIVSLPVDIKVNRKTRTRSAVLKVNDKAGVTKCFLDSKKLDAKNFKDKSCRFLCDSLDECKSYVVDYSNRTCTFKNTSKRTIPIDKNLIIKQPAQTSAASSPAAAASAAAAAASAASAVRR
jgi:hypothetical protein